ncbi:hypothetical protein [Streptomyces sp. 150FB]|uniref:ParB/RepB/Spo0J family partition protein n=1 Tax=Streptomyces sp. 150FB TaxID=1576605 RepID=UPI00136497F3|nr:hypothetical protein [Streptomyces sp. 150FB]
MAGRRTSLASLAGAKVDDVPGKSDPLLLTLPLTKLVPTRFNPRRNFGTQDDLKAFGLVLKKRQLQPAVVVSRAGYLKLWPAEEENVGETPYVIANGERRFRGSLAAGLLTLNVVHNEDVAASRADFLDAVLSENIDREDLDPIERAIGIETMVLELGGADQVAAHYEKTKGWVSQQRKLLKLTPALQALVSSREMPVRVARDIAGLSADEQPRAWAAETARRTEAKSAPRIRQLPKQTTTPTLRSEVGEASTTSVVAAPGREGLGQPAAQVTEIIPRPSEPAGTTSVVATPGRTASGHGDGERFTAVNQKPEQSSGDTALLAEPTPGSAPKPPIKMPWHDGAAAMDIAYDSLVKHLQKHKALARYTELAGGPEGFAADLVASSTPEFRARLIDLLIEAD